MITKDETKNVEGQLAGIVGSECISADSDVLDAYSKDGSFVAPRKPRLVVKPQNSDEVQSIVKWANQTGTPLIPVSSGPPRFRGDTVPTAGGAVIVDLSRMKRIVRIDRRNRMAIVEAGVTWSELQPELAKQGMKLPMPLLPRKSKSVIASLLEREPITIPKYHWTMLEPLRCCEIIWGNGDKMWSGDAGDSPDTSLEEQWKKLNFQISGLGPHQTDFYRLVSGAQGSMGIVAQASLRCGVLPQIHKLFFVPSDKLDELINFSYKVLRFRYGYQLFILNSANLANIITQDASHAKSIKENLPAWAVILSVAGLDRLPKEKVDFQQQDITDICQEFGLHVKHAVPGVTGNQLLEIIDKPSGDPYWKLRYSGGFHDIFFITTLDKTPQFVNTLSEISQAYGYSASDIGIYIQPVTQGVACHCEFVLPFNPDNKNETAKVQKIVTEGSKALMNDGAFFSRPYGSWAEAAYGRDARGTIALKKVKAIFDPNGVMNPGKLCF